MWKHVWTASDHRVHIPATGVDAAGHPWYLCQLRWRELRDDEKCKRSLAFAQSPPPHVHLQGRELRLLFRGKSAGAWVLHLSNDLMGAASTPWRTPRVMGLRSHCHAPNWSVIALFAQGKVAALVRQHDSAVPALLTAGASKR